MTREWLEAANEKQHLAPLSLFFVSGDSKWFSGVVGL
jgi:hypothetical protein